MLQFSHIYATRQQALDSYKTQLSQQRFFAVSFEGYAAGTPAVLHLEITETSQKIDLSARVDRLVGRKEAVEKRWGNASGVMLSVPIVPEIVAPLRNFYLASSVNEGRAVPAPPVKKCGAPFEGLETASPDEVNREAEAFLERSENGSLFDVFGVPLNADRNDIRTVYNTTMKRLHPDRYQGRFSSELCQMLARSFQIINESYQILQNPIDREIYMDVSRAQGAERGMSLARFQTWRNDYQLKNASNVRLAADFVQKAVQARQAGNEEIAAQDLKLALKYDPYCAAARNQQRQSRNHG